uniref:Uncharacterized protein n=1 Tax=Arundo donax TaxID=35708 RepID=A0A0A8ZPZ9_ARUDO
MIYLRIILCGVLMMFIAMTRATATDSSEGPIGRVLLAPFLQSSNTDDQDNIDLISVDQFNVFDDTHQ